MKDAPKKPEQRNAWKYSGLVVGYVALWYAWIYFHPDEEHVVVFYLPLAYCLMIVLHELGHVMAAALVGFRFREIMVLGISLSRTPSGWQVRFGEVGLAGHARAIPIGLDRLPKRLAIAIIGGPLTDVVSIVVAAFLFYIWPASPFLIMWIVVNLLALSWSLFEGSQNDRWHLHQALGKGEGSNGYLASHVICAEGVDDQARQAKLEELGFPYAMDAERIRDLTDRFAYAEVLEKIETTLASPNIAIEYRVWLECTASFYYAFRRLDVGKAAALLPPESRAKTYDCEGAWIYAATMVATAQARWTDAAALAQRGIDHPRVSGEVLKWFELARRFALRQLERSARA